MFLKLLGSKGNAASAIVVKQGLGLGKGSVLNYIRRATYAVLSFFSDTVLWPNAVEWVEISTRIQDEFHFPKCFGMINGAFSGLPISLRFRVKSTLIASNCMQLTQ